MRWLRIEAAGALEKLNDIRVAFLGKKGELTSIMKSMKEIAPEERPAFGQMVNETRSEIDEKDGGDEDRTGQKSQRSPVKG